MSRWRSTSRLIAADPAGLGRPFGESEATGTAKTEGLADTTDPAGEAVARGYEDGLARAQNEMQAATESFRREVQASLRRIAEYEKTFAAEYESRMLELALEIAAKIVRQRIDSGDEVAARAFEESIQSLPDSTRVKVRLHPADAGSVRERHQAEIDTDRIEIVPDDSLTRGGAILESDFGRIDATVETAEKAAREAVVGEKGME